MADRPIAAMSSEEAPVLAQDPEQAEMTPDEIGELQQPQKQQQQQVKAKMKYVSLVCLVVQNATLILTLRYTKTRDVDQFFSASAVILAEIVKLLVCLSIVLIQKSGSVTAWFSYLKENTIDQPMDSLKVAIPAIIYFIQNNLFYIAVANLPAAAYQVLYQLKILTTAMFSVLLLGKTLTKLQWVSMVVLFVGVAIVQMQTQTGEGDRGDIEDQSPVKGLLAVIASCLFSGFAGVYFEKILKESKGTIWLRNIQMSFFSIFTGVAALYVSSWKEVTTKGFLFGVDWLVWVVILMSAIGGLLVALVIKYADNILRGFATSISIIVSTVISIFLLNFHLTGMFSLGASIVIVAVYLYSLPAATVPKDSQEV